MPRVQLALNVYLFSILGVFLLAVPWTPVWEQASTVWIPTPVGLWVRSGWMRGVVSGLGALNLLVATQGVGVLWRSFRKKKAALFSGRLGAGVSLRPSNR